MEKAGTSLANYFQATNCINNTGEQLRPILHIHINSLLLFIAQLFIIYNNTNNTKLEHLLTSTEWGVTMRIFSIPRIFFDCFVTRIIYCTIWKTLDYCILESCTYTWLKNTSHHSLSNSPPSFFPLTIGDENTNTNC